MIKITSTNDVIIVEGDELTRHYPNNGTLVIPKNSTLVLLDEASEMVLFKSASNYDTLFTGILGSILIEDELVTRENIIEKFNAISNVNVGGNVDLFEVVQSLPTENISDNKVYLVIDSNGSEGNTYVEYLYVNGKWEELGKFKVNIDLSGYATEDWVNSQGFLKEHQDISNLATKAELATKQDVINDLETIRSGAAKGATALQSVPSEYATEQWVNEQGFLKEHQDISNLATKEELNAKQDTISDLETIRSGAAKGATALQSVPDTYALKSEIPDITTKQDTLVSGTNIKTLNGTSLLGSGNIEINASADNVPTVQTTSKGTTSNYVYSSGLYNKYCVISDIKSSVSYGADIAYINLQGYYWGSSSEFDDATCYITGATTSQAGLMSASDKSKLDGIDLSTKQDTLVSGTNIKTVNGTSLLGSGNIEISTNVDLSDYATKSELATKQDVISDLETIRSGAALGATALQSVPDTYATEEWVNTQGFLKEHQDISNLATKEELNAKQDTINDLDSIRSGAALGATALQSVPSEYVTETELNNKGYLTSVPDTYALKSEIPDISTKQDTLVSGTNIKTINGNSLLGSGDITIEGGSGNVDLSNYYTKTETNELVNPKLEQVTLTQAEYDALQTKEDNVLYIISDAEDLKFKTINGQQITGEGNITIDTDVDLSGYATKSELNTKQNIISDLDSIRSGAAKGATALQSVPSTYALKTDIPDITTKQDTLVSGTNIKTVNGISLLGEGNITVSGADLSGYYTKAEIDSMIGGASNTITEINNLVV